METEQNDSVIPGGSRLQLKKKEFREPGVLQEPDPGKKRRKPRRRKQKQPAKDSQSFGLRFLGQTVGTFLLASLVLGGFLYHQATGMELLTPEQANLARGIAIASFLLLVIIEAFTEDMMQGILCFFLLPYSFVYGLLFADAGPIRGLTLSVVLFLGAEIYFTPDNALAPTVTTTVNRWIAEGQDRLINPDGRREAGYE